MTNLATRFPSDLSYDVFFDSTVFVSATITEVVRTSRSPSCLWLSWSSSFSAGSGRCRAGFHHRHFCGDAAHWLFSQTVSLLALVLAIDNETAEPFV
jgi:hypothetical protein